MPAPIAISLLAGGLGRYGFSSIVKRSGLFREMYSKFSQSPLGFGILYAGGTTIGYNMSPFNQGSKYMGRPQKLMRL